MGYGISFPQVKTRTTAGDASGLPAHLSAFLGKVLEGVLIMRLYPYLQQKWERSGHIQNTHGMQSQFYEKCRCLGLGKQLQTAFCPMFLKHKDA